MDCVDSTAENKPQCYAVLVGIKRKADSPQEMTGEEPSFTTIEFEDKEPDLMKPFRFGSISLDEDDDCEKQNLNSVFDDDDDDICEELNTSCALVGKRRINPPPNENVAAGNGYSFFTPTTPRDQIIRKDVRVKTPWAPRRNPKHRRKYGIIHVRQPDFMQELTPYEVMPYNVAF